jgi:hypothetical protein
MTTDSPLTGGPRRFGVAVEVRRALCPVPFQRPLPNATRPAPIGPQEA